MIIPFIYLLREMGIPVTLQYVMEFYDALDKGLVTDLDRLFVVGRLIFVKRVEHFDAYERAFASYYLGKEDGRKIPHAQSVFESEQFREWLQREIDEGTLSAEVLHEMPIEELMQRFWETALKQDGEHHGGDRWIGTGGTSPWGHSGRSRGGIRVHGSSMHRSALKVVGERRYLDYSPTASLSAENIRHALATLKRMVPVGPATELDIDKTVDKTCRNGGEIELVFDRELRDKLKVMLLLDNGGYSMSPYVRMVSVLFSKMRDQFKDLEFYYFHNCIYGGAYSDPRRTNLVGLRDLCEKGRDTRLVVVGDADMAPSELFYSHGAIDYYSSNRIPGMDWLQLLADAFPHAVWLNPIRRERWPFSSVTLKEVGKIFHMEDLTLDGLKKAVEYLQRTGSSPRFAV